ncbi:CDGSH iron-sulfur domain-containing protein [Virgibacillus flavescens]|uniref:CDGSH iron-sulfur domain-containing protein n=1 Tax=Virgibacillus flavescens TaxID=1611422 RepID=UPI003D339F27
MSEKAQIKVNDDGSLRVSGDIELIDGEGNAYTTKKVFSLCRCGHSFTKPYCDGTHKKKGFESKVRV